MDIQLAQPTTVLTDYLLAGVALALGMRLALGSSVPWGRMLWGAAFLAGAVEAIAGGTVHGFAGHLSPVAWAALWRTHLVCSGLAGGLLVSGMALATLRRGWCRAVLLVAMAKLILYVAIVSRSDLTRIAVWDGAGSIVLVLALTLIARREDSRRLGWLVLGLGLAGVALVVQRSGVSLHQHFNHNDACHVILLAVLWALYAAGLRLQDHARPLP